MCMGGISKFERNEMAYHKRGKVGKENKSYQGQWDWGPSSE